ncbi:STAS domain-containing protein [Flindersiella endophytica]
MDDHGAWISAYDAGSVRVVVACGELDLAVAPQLKERLLVEVARRPDCVVVDLTEVSFLDCAALGSLLVSNRRAKLLGVEFVLVGVSGTPKRVLALTGTAEAFVSHPDLDTALTACKARRNPDRASG